MLTLYGPLSPQFWKPSLSQDKYKMDPSWIKEGAVVINVAAPSAMASGKLLRVLGFEFWGCKVLDVGLSLQGSVGSFTREFRIEP